MTGHTESSIDIEAPVGFLFSIVNNVREWPDLYTEYASVDVLDETAHSARFRLTMHPDKDGKVWSWVSERTWDEQTRNVEAHRVETGPFEFMNIAWTFAELAPDRTRMTWVQDFHMKDDAPVDDAWMVDNITRNSAIQQRVIKERIEKRRTRVVGFTDVPTNSRRGGDLRTMLSPNTVGSSSGFCGAVRLAKGERVTEHYHPYSEEYLFVCSGQLRVDLDGTTVIVRAEQGVLIPRKVRHRLVNQGESDVLAVFHLAPLAPRPELGHVDTEPGPGDAAAEPVAVVAQAR
ncbi:MAG TPA: cupin domain-containing protein [Pseudonocardiaceae bacterium]|nr:cupin domain-containing protein [Pseudonocardiaceae bacterium]